MNLRRLCLPALCLTVATACAPEDPQGVSGRVAPADPSASDPLLEKLQNGALTNARPEVGKLTVGCTGTLVSPDVVITAAHCVGFGSALEPGRRGSFLIEAADGSEQAYTVSQYRSYSAELGADDIALLQLAVSVPPEVATPAPLATTRPADGASLTVFGYGCTQRGTHTDWQKRKATFRQGDDTAHLCPGDSGGPVFDDARGAVLRINSGYYRNARGSDLFGLVPGLVDTLQTQVDAWTRSPRPAPPVDSTPPEVEVLTPVPGDVWSAGSTVSVSALIRDTSSVARAELVWSFNGNRYACPSRSTYVDCVVQGEERLWTVRIGTGSRTFRVEAADAAGNLGSSPEITVQIH